jgi:hypothetical protein
MNLIDLISQNKLSEAKELVYNQLNSIAAGALEELKPIVVENTYVEDLYEAGSPNRIKMGRVVKIRRRIRRNKKGRIIVQKNVRRSAIKGYRISGNTVKRVPAIQRINKARKLKRYWKTKGRAKLGRTLLKRKMSMRRRTSMGIR